MSDANQFLDQAIGQLSLADPLVTLLQEVKLGRMNATDAGLKAVTESWLETYRRVLGSAHCLDRTALLRLDPSPRVEVLINAGVLAPEHPGVRALRAEFEQRLVECK
ncbi:MAG TPA: hypothetical protein VJ692_06865 [Nitrospiraceae bacterium]|nr:hypothetical protein [Nitrospiraceae bacterium]